MRLIRRFEAADLVVGQHEVDGGDGCIAPTRDTIADTSYPLSRTLYIYVNKAKITENPAVKAKALRRVQRLPGTISSRST